MSLTFRLWLRDSLNPESPPQVQHQVHANGPTGACFAGPYLASKTMGKVCFLFSSNGQPIPFIPPLTRPKAARSCASKPQRQIRTHSRKKRSFSDSTLASSRETSLNFVPPLQDQRDSSTLAVNTYRFFGLLVCPAFFFAKFLSNVTGCFGSYSPMAPPPGSDIVVRVPHRSSEILPTRAPFFCRAATCAFKLSHVKNISCLLFWSSG